MSEVKKLVQQGLDQWFLRQDVIDQLLQSGDDDLEGISAYADRILMIAQTEEAEHQTLEDPFDRSVALVLSLVNSEGLGRMEHRFDIFPSSIYQASQITGKKSRSSCLWTSHSNGLGGS